MDHADVLPALREVGRMENSLRDGDSNTVERLRDSQVKLGVARHEYYTGSLNHMRTVTVSRNTLLNVLEKIEALMDVSCVQE
jgi:hypothetical protein